MNEASDAPAPTSAAVAVEGAVDPDAMPNVDAEGLAAAGPDCTDLDSQKCHAVIIGKWTAGREFEDAEVRKYEAYLDRCGFEVTSKDSESLDVAKLTLAQAAGSCGRFVALVMRESEREADLDDLVRCLNECNGEALKLLIFCRIVGQDSAERADCLRPMPIVESRQKLRNIIIISCAVQTRKLAAKFVKLMTKWKANNWSSTGLSHMVQYDIATDKYEKYGIKTQNGLTKEFGAPKVHVKLLRDNRRFQEFIGRGAHLKSLDESVVRCLKSSPDCIGELVYRNSGRRKALVIHNVNFANPACNRPESRVDFLNLWDTLTLLGYDVTERVDLTAGAILTAVQAFADDESHGDSCVLAIMSHGSLGAICGTDYKESTEEGVLKEADLLDSLRKGRAVRAKPRLVIFQTCQTVAGGQKRSEKDDGSDPELSDATRTTVAERASDIGRHYGSPTWEMEPLPDQCGMIVGHSTSPGECAFRSTHGSRFILALCATFLEFAHKEDIVAMITRVNYVMTHGFKRPYFNRETVANQLPCWLVQTDKKFFLVNTNALFDIQESPPDSWQPKASDAVGEPVQSLDD